MMNILLVADRPNWAYDILAKSIKNHSRYSSIDIQYISVLREDLSKGDFSPYDVVFFFLWYDAMRYGVKVKGFDFSKTCVGIHSLSSWIGRGFNEKQASLVCNQFAAAGYISQEIGNLLNLEKGFFTPNGVDEKLFFSSPLPPLEELRLMWVGNPGNSHHGINKGFHTIVKPISVELQQMGVKLVTATPETPVTRKMMGEFYRENHILVCSSLHEGGPLPVLEALSCGRPVITTSVGIVPEIIKHKINGIIYERSKSGLRNAIMNLLDNPETIQKMAKSTVQSVSNRTSLSMAQSYDAMFHFVEES